MILAAAVALHLVTFTGPDGQLITVNREDVVTIRRPRGNDHFAPGTNCLLHLSDGKYITIAEDCKTAIERLVGEDED